MNNKILSLSLIVTAAGVSASTAEAMPEKVKELDAKILPGGRIEATLPDDATHYTFVIVDDKNFAIAYPEVTISVNARVKNYTDIALEVK